MRQVFFLSLSSILVVLSSCKDYYNDTLHWADNIQKGTDIQTVKKMQPDFVTINWNRPDTLDKSLRFAITKIKGSNDVLGMRQFLLFEEGKYIGRRYSRK